jgi:hypothetical protein
VTGVQTCALPIYQNSAYHSSHTVKASEGWYLAIDNLPKYDGNNNLYVYTVVERPVTGYKTTIIEQIDPTLSDYYYFAINSETFAVTYDGNGHTSGAVPADNNEYLSGDAVTVLGHGSMDKTGYTFMGWTDNRTKATAGLPDYAYNRTSNTFIPATFTITADTVLYAVWIDTLRLADYTIYFDANTGVGSMRSMNVTYGSQVTLPANTFTKSGHTFSVWNTAADKSGDYYTNQEAFIYNIDNDTTLYAQWNPTGGGGGGNVGKAGTVHLVVRFVDWDGTVLKIQLVPVGGSATAPPNPSHVNYTFTGWDRPFTNVRTNITVIALYEPIVPPIVDPPKEPPILSTWALINLILCVTGILLTAGVFVYVWKKKKLGMQNPKLKFVISLSDIEKQKNRKMITLYAILITSALSLLIFLITLQSGSTREWADDLTPVHVILFIAEIAAVAYLFKLNKVNEV